MRSSLVACVFIPLAVPLAFAQEVRATRTVPADDLGVLAGVAPPVGRATGDGLYGDAAFARGLARASGRRARAAAIQRPQGCPSERQPGARSCDEGSVFFRRNFVFTPSYVSAPQIFDRSRQDRTDLLSPVTSFFLNPFD